METIKTILGILNIVISGYLCIMMLINIMNMSLVPGNLKALKMLWLPWFLKKKNRKLVRLDNPANIDCILFIKL